jgi:hypothetical protein
MPLDQHGWHCRHPQGRLSGTRGPVLCRDTLQNGVQQVARVVVTLGQRIALEDVERSWHQNRNTFPLAQQDSKVFNLKQADRLAAQLMNRSDELGSAGRRVAPGVAFDLFEGLLPYVGHGISLSVGDPRYELLRVIQQSTGLAQFVLRGRTLILGQASVADLALQLPNAVDQASLRVTDLVDMVPRRAVRLAGYHFPVELTPRTVEILLGEMPPSTDRSCAARFARS